MTLIYMHEVTFVSRMDRRIYPGLYNPRARGGHTTPQRLLYPSLHESDIAATKITHRLFARSRRTSTHNVILILLPYQYVTWNIDYRIIHLYNLKSMRLVVTGEAKGRAPKKHSNFVIQNLSILCT